MLDASDKFSPSKRGRSLRLEYNVKRWITCNGWNYPKRWIVLNVRGVDTLLPSVGEPEVAVRRRITTPFLGPIPEAGFCLLIERKLGVRSRDVV